MKNIQYLYLYEPSKKTQKSLASMMNLASKNGKNHYFLIIYSYTENNIFE